MNWLWERTIVFLTEPLNIGFNEGPLSSTDKFLLDSGHRSPVSDISTKRLESMTKVYDWQTSNNRLCTPRQKSISENRYKLSPCRLSRFWWMPSRMRSAELHYGQGCHWPRNNIHHRLRSAEYQTNSNRFIQYLTKITKDIIGRQWCTVIYCM